MTLVSYTFRYQNRRKETVHIWLAEPPVHHGQCLQQKAVRRAPDQVSPNDIAGNQISYYVLEPGEAIHNEYTIAVTPSDEWDSPRSLSDEEQTYYLRSSAFVCITDEIRELADRICRGLDTDEAKARALFNYVRNSFRYIYPPKGRGTVFFLRNKKGDCGEFSFLYAALCRAQGIPCRTVVGAFATGKHQAHVWNEVFLAGRGWIPVDTSMANVQKRQPWRFLFSSIRTLRPADYFGRLEDQRVIFSLETDLAPVPPYPKDKAEGGVEFPVNDQVLSWGTQVIDGSMPYLQPMYYYSRDTESKVRMDDIIGDYRVQERGLRYGLLVAKGLLGWGTIMAAGLYWLSAWGLMSLSYSIFAIGYSLVSIVRRERPLFFSAVTVFFITLLVIPFL
jgi:hypothetical protein